MTRAQSYVKQKRAEYRQNLQRIQDSIALEYMERVKTEMENQGLSQYDLALNLDMKPSQVSRTLNHPGNLTLSTLVALSAALNGSLRIEFSGPGLPSDFDGDNEDDCPEANNNISPFKIWDTLFQSTKCEISETANDNFEWKTNTKVG